MWLALATASASACGGGEKAPFYSDPGKGGSERDAAAQGHRDDAATGGGDQDASTPGDQDAAKPEPMGCDDGPELHVLFIGNSHTYVNDLPALVREMGCALGTKIITDQSTPGGVFLRDHATNAETLAKIAAEPWDAVVLQDQQQAPSYRLPDVDSDEVPNVVTVANAIKANSEASRRLFYMVYARDGGDPGNCDYYPLLCTFEGATLAIEQGYRLFQDRTGGEMAPAALAVAKVHADPDSPLASPKDLWMGDGYHPSPATSYLVAAVMLNVLLDQPTADVAFNGPVSPEVAKYLRGIADETVREQAMDPYAQVEERVAVVGCDAAHGCDPADADAKPTVFQLSKDTCTKLLAGTAKVIGHIDTTLSCENDVCTTAPLGSYHDLSVGTIADGDYQVLSFVDVNENGKLDAGDLQACKTKALSVGSGKNAAFDTFTTR